MNRHNLRDKKTGKFTTLAPIGTLAYFSKYEDGRPYFSSGWHVVVGVGKNGIVSCVPYTTAPTKLHLSTFNLKGAGKMDVDHKTTLGKKELQNFVRCISNGVKKDNGKNPAYYCGAFHCADQLKLASKML
jgi:hypothetical protein